MPKQVERKKSPPLLTLNVKTTGKVVSLLLGTGMDQFPYFYKYLLKPHSFRSMSQEHMIGNYLQSSADTVVTQVSMGDTYTLNTRIVVDTWLTAQKGSTVLRAGPRAGPRAVEQAAPRSSL